MITCPKCNIEFSQDREYRVHAIEKHGAPQSILQGEQNLIQPPPGFKEGAAIIPPLSPKEITEFDDEGQHYVPITSPPPKQPISSPPVVPQEPETITPQAIVLQYKYEGTCEKGHRVTTLLIEVAKETHCLAYCDVCKQSVFDRKVKPL